MKRISASEAKTLSETYGEQYKYQVLERELDEFYAKILEVAQSGKTSVKVMLKPCVSCYKDSITKILTGDGYKVKYRFSESYRDFDEYIIISWVS
jgi:hypothetical protein